MKIFRRQYLAGSVLGLASSYALYRGIRYPRLSLEPRERNEITITSDAKVGARDFLHLFNSATPSWRALTPEPSLTIHPKGKSLRLQLYNLAINSILQVEGAPADVHEEVSGTRRDLELRFSGSKPITLKWKTPTDDGFRFAIIGDTGGGSELRWCLSRAHDLGAQFLLHLGDFNYGGNEYQTAIDQFQDSPLPCYISIGNHDFHDNGLIYHKFLSQLGPMNNRFTLAGSEFINIDTAADFFPASRGLRGELFYKLLNETQNAERVFFTHRPLRDPRPHDDHNIGGVGEVQWLTKKIQASGSSTLLCGHVHHSAELDVEGIHQWTAGEGLAHEDLVCQKQVAQLLIGSVEPGRRNQYQWVDLDMPWNMHTSPTHAKKLIRDNRLQQLDWYSQLNKQTISSVSEITPSRSWL